MEYLQRFMLHAMMVLCDSEFATLARFITRLVLPMATLDELVFLPESISLIIACDFVLETGMFHLKPEYVMQVKVRWLKLNCAKHWLNILFHFLELLSNLRRAKPTPALICTTDLPILSLRWGNLVFVKRFIIGRRTLGLDEASLWVGLISWLTALLVGAPVADTLRSEAAFGWLGDANPWRTIATIVADIRNVCVQDQFLVLIFILLSQSKLFALATS